MRMPNKVIILSCCKEQFNLSHIDIIENYENSIVYFCPRCGSIHESTVYAQILIPTSTH